MPSRTSPKECPVPRTPGLLRATALALLGAALGASLAPASVDAQAADRNDDDRRRRWSWSAAAARAAQASPQVQAAHAHVDAAHAHRAFEEVPVIGNPYLSVRALFGVPSDPAATYGVMVGLPFDLSDRSGRWSRETEQLIAVADAELEAAANTSAGEALAAYVEVAVAQQGVELAQARYELAQRVVESTRARVDAQAATVVDLSLVEAELGLAGAELQNRRRALVSAQAQLRGVLDLAPDVAPEVEPLAEAGPPSISLANALALARDRRAEPRAHQAAARRYRLSEDRLFSESSDLLMIGLEWETQGNQNPNHSFGLSAAMALPLVRTNQGDRAVARAMSHLEIRLGVLAERNVEREVAAAWHALDAALAELATLENDAVPAAERVLEMTETLLAAGSVDLFRVLVARRDAFALRGRHLDALRDVWLARIALERAVGGPIE